MTGGELAVGDTVEVQVGAVAHGGHCVARHDGRVLFVRHALPGETVRAVVTEAKHAAFVRADAIQVLEASPARVSAPCAHFRPGGCGGCDFQHATPGAQRALKGAVVAEQLRRLGGVDRVVEVEELPGTGFGWRTRVRWGVDPSGRLGPRVHRSAAVVPLTAERPCLIAAPGLSQAATELRRQPGAEVALTAAPDGSVLIGADRPDSAADRPRRDRAAHSGASAPLTATTVEAVFDRDFEVAADGFWQVHPQAPEALVDAVLEQLPEDPSGAMAWDLYGGVGLFAAFLGAAVGPEGHVWCVESDAAAVELARRNVQGLPVEVLPGRVEQTIAQLPDPRIVVLDPPRSGAGKAICQAITERHPEVIVYVACDPAALGRDTRTLRDAGYELTGLRVFDAFPQTHHVECVATFRPAELAS